MSELARVAGDLKGAVRAGGFGAALLISVGAAAAESDTVYLDFVAVAVRELGVQTVTLSDVQARLQLAEARRLLGCEGAGCDEVAEALAAQLEAQEIVTVSIVRSSTTAPALVVMARIDTASGVALARFEGQAATDVVLRQTLRRGARTLFGREVPPDAVGTLLVQTEPRGVRVTLDGTPRGVAPLVLERIAAGDHELVLTSSSGRVLRPVFVEPQRVSRVRISMRRPPVTVHVFSEPPGARVRVDGAQYERTPLIVEEVTRESITVELERSGYRSLRRTVRLDAGRHAATGEPLVVLEELARAWPVAVGAIVGTTFDAVTPDAGTAFSFEATVDPIELVQVGVGFTSPSAVVGSLRIYPLRDIVDVGVVARVVGFTAGGTDFEDDGEQWEAALMGGLTVRGALDTDFGRFGIVLEGGPSFLLDDVDRFTVPVSIGGFWSYQ